MDRNSSLLKLKLDLVYRDLAIEEGQKRFDELNLPHEEVAAAPDAPLAVVDAPKVKKKVVRALVPAGEGPKRTMASERTKKAAQPPRAVLPADK